MTKMSNSPYFRSKFSEDIFNHKYRHEGCETWPDLANTLVEDVCRNWMSQEEKTELKQIITKMQFIPGGRYLYYAGRPFKAFNNCYLLRSEEDSREDWANLSWKAESCLMTGGGIGNDYTMYRPKNSVIKRTGGLASGPVSKMRMINEIGREVMQGGSRRSAIYASLNWKHDDIHEFIHAKDWYNQKVLGTDLTIGDLKEKDFNFPAPLDMTNISVNYDTEWLEHFKKTGDVGNVFLDNIKQALKTSEPGFSFNFYEKERETLRNAPVAGDTYILTRNGYVQVIDIVGQEVEVWTGKQWAKTTFNRTKELTETITIEITGGRTITCDPEHEFFVKKYIGKGKKRKLEIVKIAAKDLKVNTPLLVELPSKEKENFNSTDYTLGYAYGDGSFRGSGGGEITFCTEESKKCFQHTDKSLYSSINENDSRGYVRAYLKSSIIGDKLKLNCPKNVSASFIAGLFDADGNWFEPQSRIRLASKNFSFLEDVRRELEQFGILSTITRGGISTYGKKQGYLLNIMLDYVNLFFDIIPCKRLKVSTHKAYRNSELRVCSIENGPIQDVFCCDVKVEEHSFMAEGVIISNCTEVTSEDDSDVCNLGSINLAKIDTISEFEKVVELSTKFLLCGTLVADLPYEKVYKVREKNRRLGLGLMGMHEWLLKRDYKYEVTPELHQWLKIYKEKSDKISKEFSDALSISRPVANRAIAPTGSIGILAGTTTGIEPLFAVAYKRRYLKGRHQWVYQYVVDGTAKILIEQFGVSPDSIESAVDLASDYERRIKFQADVQDYVDMSISSTINLPAWGTELNNEDTVVPFARTLARYAHRLRGFTCYADGSRGGQPITPVSYYEAIHSEGKEFEEVFSDICEIGGKGGVCGA